MSLKAGDSPSCSPLSELPTETLVSYLLLLIKIELPCAFTLCNRTVTRLLTVKVEERETVNTKQL